MHKTKTKIKIVAFYALATATAALTSACQADNTGIGRGGAPRGLQNCPRASMNKNYYQHNMRGRYNMPQRGCCFYDNCPQRTDF